MKYFNRHNLEPTINRKVRALIKENDHGHMHGGVWANLFKVNPFYFYTNWFSRVKSLFQQNKVVGYVYGFPVMIDFKVKDIEFV